MRFCSRVFVLLAIFVLVLSGCRGEKPPRAEKGVLDLREWDLERHGAIPLNGEWAFYWKRLIPPEAFKQNPELPRTGFHSFPGCWNGKNVHGNKLSGQGYATFHLTVLMPSGPRPKAMKILNLSSAYTLWADGTIVAKNGEVGTSRETSRPQYLLQNHSFMHDTPSLDLVLQVANFHHRKGGIWHSIDLGIASEMSYNDRIQWIFDLALFGALLVMGIYHFSFFWLRREEPSSLFFSFFCLALALRTLVSGHFYLTQLFPHCPFELLYALELLSVVIPMPMLLCFFIRLFPGSIHAGWVYGVLISAGAIAVGVLLLPARLASYLVLPNQAVIFLSLGLILVALFKALRGKKPGARILLFGILCFGMTATVDILIVNFLLPIKQLVPLGVFVMILCQSLVLSRRYAKAYAALKENVSLRQEVSARRASEMEQKMRQVRLARILDTIEDAIVAVDENRTIVFCNRHVAALTGEDPNRLVGRPAFDFVAEEMRSEIEERLETVFDQDDPETGPPAVRELTVVHRTRGLRRVKAEAVPLRISEEPLLVARLYDGLDMGIRRKRGPGHGSELLFLSELAKNRSRLHAMEDALSIGRSSKEPCDVTRELRSIDTAMKQMEAVLLGGENDGDKRRAGVEVMHAALACWQEATGQGRVELARRSKLWKIHTNQNGFERTQTLDRYLDMARFPKKPRWNQVYQTVEFVLLMCKEPSPVRTELEVVFSRLKMLES